MDEFDSTHDKNEMFDLHEISSKLDLKDHDLERKEIGDRVIITDSSSMTHEDKRELDFDDYNDMDFTAYFIVIATHQRRLYHNTYKNYCQDLIIVNPRTNKQYRIISGHVRIYNPNEDKTSTDF